MPKTITGVCWCPMICSGMATRSRMRKETPSASEMGMNSRENVSREVMAAILPT